VPTLQNLGFFMMSSAFVIAAMQRHLETRGRNDPEASNSRMTTVGFAGAIGLMAVSFVFLSGGERMWSVFGPLIGVGVLGLVALTVNAAVGGSEVLEKAPKQFMAWLEHNEEFLGKYIFPYTALVAAFGVALEAINIFVK
jgi:predicted tellurium resistance membrane protein TerC